MNRFALAPAVLVLVCLNPAWAAEPQRVLDRASALRRAIEDLVREFGDRYPNGHSYLATLAELERRAHSADEAELDRIKHEFESSQRQALAANPLVSGQPMLLVVRPQYWGNHGAINTMFQNGELQEGTFRGGGALKSIRFDAEGKVAEVATLVDVPKGIARDPEVSFDGRRIVFAMRKNRADDYHSVYPVNPFGRSPLDGKQLGRLAQLAGRGVNDFKHDPALQISFTRPELSPVLKRFKDKNDPAYQEALAIIRAGKEQLARLPREDMLGPQAGARIAADVRRDERYRAHVSAQARARQAMLTGRKAYRGQDE